MRNAILAVPCYWPSLATNSVATSNDWRQWQLPGDPSKSHAVRSNPPLSAAT